MTVGIGSLVVVPAGQVSVCFAQEYGCQAQGLWAAPGRINLIGEHTDYNDGHVLPLALRRGVVAAAAPRHDRLLRIRSCQAPMLPFEANLDDLAAGSVSGWAAYPAGVAWSLQAGGHALVGTDVLVAGDIPIGAGLSSSAALECATASALAGVAGLVIEPGALAMIATRAENDFVGVPCGVMDQLAALRCIAGHALWLDTRTLDVEQVPFDPGRAGLVLLAIDTGSRHALVNSEYADRRRACEEAARILGVEALRDVDPTGLTRALDQLPDPVLKRRARHVVTENARVLETVDRLRGGDLAGIGPLLSASHMSLRDDYEVSSPELDTAVECALGAGALGARMTGGGFGGCAIALIPDGLVHRVLRSVRAAYVTRRFAPPAAFAVHPARGASRRALRARRPSAARQAAT
jgi:galactokinase